MTPCGEITRPEDKNRVFHKTREPIYTEEQNLALILEQHRRGLRTLTDAQLQAVEENVSAELQAWAKAL